MVQEFSENGLIIFRKIVPGSVLFVYFLLLVITSSAQTGNAESTGKTKLFIKKKLNFDTLPRKKYNFFILPLFSPPEYKVFENDPMGLFTKTGVRISANIRYLPQPWCSQKYMQTHLISINYGVLRTSLNAGYVGRFNHAVGPFDLLLKARYDWRSIENYFGTGNETQKTNSTKNYYRTVSTKFYGGIGLSTKIGNNQTFDVSAFYQNAKLKNVNSNSIYGDHGIDSSLFNNKQFGGAEVAYHFRKTNNDKFPTAGVDFFFSS